METTELLKYLKFAQQSGYVLYINGIKGKSSKIYVDSYKSDKLEGRFCSSNKQMSYYYKNIVSCRFFVQAEQRKFEKWVCKEIYGEDTAKRIEYFKEYYKQIIEKEPDKLKELDENQKNVLKQQKLKCLEEMFAQIYQDPNNYLRQYILGSINDINERVETNPILLLSRSNFSQKQAIENALSKPVTIIEGPPGTGKTTTILSIVSNLLVRGNKVVVVSKNNSAIENIKEELDKFQLPRFYLRLGRKKLIETKVNPNIKSWVQETFMYQESFEEENDEYDDLYKLYSELQTIEKDINELIEKKNQLQEDENMLRHIEKRGEAFQINHFQMEKEFPKIKKFQNRSIENMRREIDRIAHSLQQLDYENYYSIMNRLKNGFIWKMGRKRFETEGMMLQFQLEYLYLIQEIQILSEELKNAGLEDKQKKLKMIYDEQYVDLSVKLLRQFLYKFFSDVDYCSMAKSIIKCEDINIYDKCKDKIHKMYPVILTTADAFPFNFKDYFNGSQKIDYIIMDEASQCDILAALPVLYLAKHCVIVGDQKQLSAITDETIKVGLPEVEKEYDFFSENFLSSVKKVWDPPVVLLREHYRCDYTIINYCNKYFYNNELIIYTESHPDSMELLKVDHGKYAQPDFSNEREIKSIEGITGEKLKDTYVITPFKTQGEMLREHFQCGKDTCGTIHTFQGRGQENIFFSTVLNDLYFANNHLASNHCLFKDDLINVAVSRAKNNFILVSDALYFRNKNKQMRNLIDYIESYGKQIPDTTVCIFDGLYKKMKSYTRHDNLDNVFEETLYRYIEDYCNKHQQVCCWIKLPLADLVTDKTYLDEHPDIKRFVMHHNAHVDFTLCNAVNKPILAIELDGKKHGDKIQIERDKKKNEALKHMHIPLWRLPSKKALTKDEFEQRLRSYILE